MITDERLAGLIEQHEYDQMESDDSPSVAEVYRDTVAALRELQKLRHEKASKSVFVVHACWPTCDECKRKISDTESL